MKNDTTPSPDYARLMRKVDKDGPDGCWLWTGYLDKFGYGKTTLRGVATSAHRLVWIHSGRGPIPDGLQIDHLCRNPQCVNPQHMEATTRSVNVQRAYDAKHAATGRATVDGAPHGTRNGYGYHKCRCDECTAANREAHREQRLKRRGRLSADPAAVEHGRPSTYGNWGCRCAECTTAHSAAMVAREGAR